MAEKARARAERVAKVVFPDLDTFQREYTSNLVNGGVFLRTDEAFALREMVEVQLDFRWVKKSLRLPGEVVHIVPAEMAGMGGTQGVAVQFAESASAVRSKLRELGLPIGEPEKAPDKGVRSAARTPVRVVARIAGASQVVDGQTRNLSRTGVLVGVRGGAIPVGESVRLTLCNPTNGSECAIDGRVVRQVESGAEISAVAVQFMPPEEEREAAERFIADLQQIEHARRLGGISGPIAALGPQNIVQMFATSAPEGTLLLRHGEEEGLVCFQGGLLRVARVGKRTGVEALVHMFSWRDGSFEFHARLEENGKGPPLPLEAALLDAVRQMDEGDRFPLHAHVTLVAGADVDGYESPTKVEAAILDLARAGFTVQRMLDVIPEPDPEILRALQSLRDAGLVELST
ncbi:MAG TPA: PilZ domain-containing protein [Myxococcota bacterium]|nr:PilZ domain-containing protein [Myxococcota bacterium]